MCECEVVCLCVLVSNSWGHLHVSADSARLCAEHSTYASHLEVGVGMNPILLMKKLRLRNLMTCPKSHTKVVRFELRRPDSHHRGFLPLHVCPCACVHVPLGELRVS